MQPKTAPTPAYYKPTIPSQKRRAPWHNYYGKSAYMVTFNKRQGCPALSTLEYTQPETAFTNLTPTGQILQGQIEATPGLRPEVKIHDYVIMPDHVHILLEVLQPMQSHLREFGITISNSATLQLGMNYRAASHWSPDFSTGAVYCQRTSCPSDSDIS